jgi:hypothetical protein
MKTASDKIEGLSVTGVKPSFNVHEENGKSMSMPIEARGGVVSMGCFSGCCGVVFADYPRGHSTRRGWIRR